MGTLGVIRFRGREGGAAGDRLGALIRRDGREADYSLSTVC